eukprot:5643272-Alexandrium_andersonii.AAC.1
MTALGLELTLTRHLSDRPGVPTHESPRARPQDTSVDQDRERSQISVAAHGATTMVQHAPKSA